MKLNMTEALSIDFDAETWNCRKCNHNLGSAKKHYKEGLVVRARNPDEIHQSILDPELYDNTFAPKPEMVQILEYYCPSCALLAEAEYLPPGHPPVIDMELDFDSLKRIAEKNQKKASETAMETEK